jgi:hypothetical protein
MTDLINKPPHYNAGSVECIVAIQASMSPEEFKGYLKGNAMKYLWRYNLKGNAIQDLEKCIWYTNRLKEVVEHGARPMANAETRTIYGHTGNS